MYLSFIVANAVGIDCIDDIKEAFNQKLIEEGERIEVGFLGLLKDMLVTVWNEKKENPAYKTEDGEVKVSNKELFDTFNRKMKEQGGFGVSPATFKEYLLEFGFSDALNRIKLEVPLPDDDTPKSRLCDIFTEHVIRKLGIERNEKKPTIQEVLEHVIPKFVDAFSEDSLLAEIVKLGLEREEAQKRVDHFKQKELIVKDDIGGWHFIRR